MKSLLVCASLSLSVLLLGALAPNTSASAPAVAGPTVQDPDLAERVVALEVALRTLQKENAELVQRQKDMVVYLDKMAKSGKELLATLDRVESLGFTKGINYESREVMLAGFRQYWNAQQSGLPRTQATPAPGARDATRR